VALDIKPSAATSANKSSSVSSKQSSKPAAGTDLFATHLAKPPAAKQSAAAKAAKPKAAAAPDKRASSSKASGPDASDKSNQTSHTDKSDRSGAHKSSNKVAATRARNQSDDSGSDARSSDSSAEGSASSANTSGAAKGRASGRGTAANGKAGSAQSADQQAADVQAATKLTDPAADESNAAGLNMLQLLAKTLAGDGSPATGPTTTDSGDAGVSESADSSDVQTDPNALALAMMSQALAAALASHAPAAANAASAGAQSASAQSAATDATASATDAPAGAPNASAQQLISLLAKDLAATANGKTDADAVRSDVATTKSGTDNTDSVDGTKPNAESFAQSLAQLGSASHFSRETNTAELQAPVGSQAWTEELGGHLTWMSHKGLESGSLRLSPEHLGPVEVQITVHDGDASVWFGANHPDTRAALEQALPRLREMFASQGMTLSDSGVSREPPRNQGRQTASHGVSAISAAGKTEANATAVARLGLGLIDTYA
jgi:flagellar hook-length control protein FliK